MHLNPLETKLLIEATLRTETPLHIGSGGSEARRSLLRLAGGEIVIPSTSWKGAFRRISELLAKSMKLNGLEELAVNLYKETKAGIRYGEPGDSKLEALAREIAKALRGEPAPTLQEIEDLEDLLRELGYTATDIEEMRSSREVASKLLDAAGKILATACPIGRLYGNGILAAKVRFLDTIIRPSINQRPGVAINRKTLTVEPRKLFFIEAIEKGYEIPLRIVIDNMKPGKTDAKILASTLEAVQKAGITIGARKSAGMGRLRLEEVEVRILDLKQDQAREEPAIGNIRKRISPASLEELINWLKGH